MISYLKDEINKKVDDTQAEFVIMGLEKSKRPYLIQEIKRFNPDVLITYNLAGFELCTLTDSISYNLLDCKQLHWLDKVNCDNESFLNKVLSIVMFFATEKEEIKKYILGNYDKIPRMYLVNEASSKNENIAKATIQMMEEAHLV